MKKFIAILAVLLLAAPAMAADWAFYGSVRMNTFYEYRDLGKVAPGNPDEDWGVVWDFQPGGRLGANVKADKLSGKLEVGLNMSSSNGGNPFNGTTGGDGFVSARRAYGEWKFADGAILKVGKDYTPVSQLTSSSVWDDDAGLLGVGDFYGGRPGQIGLQFGDFEIAFITNRLGTAGFTTGQLAGTDLDWNLPKVEARYILKLNMLQIIPFGGVQYYELGKGTSTILTDSVDVWSYVVGGAVKANIGAFYIIGEGAWGQNWGNARWSGGVHPSSGAASAASLKIDPATGTGDDTEDAESWMAALILGLKVTDAISFEIGGGYRVDDSGISGQDDAEGWKAYAQATLTLAPGVFLVPEVGLQNFGDVISGATKGDDLGYQYWAGAKWQINF